ncbi:MAG: hypothetical protein ABIK40_04490 [candidate division WOR-3 bacterium]
MIIIFLLFYQWVTIDIDTIVVNNNSKSLTMQSLVIDSFNHLTYHLAQRDG